MNSLKSYFAFVLIVLASIAFCASIWIYFNYVGLGEALIAEQNSMNQIIRSYSQTLVKDLKTDSIYDKSQRLSLADIELITEPYYSNGTDIFVAVDTAYYRYSGINEINLRELFILKKKLETGYEQQTFVVVKIAFIVIVIVFIVIAFFVYRSFAKDMNKNIDKIIQEIEQPGYIESLNIQEFDQILNSVHRYQAISSQVERQTMVMDLMSKWRIEIKKIVHDLKNPLQRILLTLSDVEKSDSVHLAMQAVEEIKLSLKNLKSMEYSEEIEKEEIEIGPFFNNIRSLFYDVEIVVQNELNQPFNFDQFAFNRMCSNVVQNAIDAGANTVTFNFFKENNKIIIDIINDGEMIKHPDKLFVPFSTTKSDGNGLGLIIILQIVSAHGGRYFLKKSDEKETIFRAELDQ